MKSERVIRRYASRPFFFSFNPRNRYAYSRPIAEHRESAIVHLKRNASHEAAPGDARCDDRQHAESAIRNNARGAVAHSAMNKCQSTGIGIPLPVDFFGGADSHTPAIAAPQSGHLPGSDIRFSST